MTSVAAQIRQLQQAPATELVERYRELFGGEPPTTRGPWLFRRIAWQLQADAHGGLSPRAQERFDALAADLPPVPPRDATKRHTGRVKGLRKKGDLVPGQVLERDYKGTQIRVAVLDDGVEYDGVKYTSLSAVARAVTGSASVNGRLFFGLTERKRGS